jgi:hypothetical protein
MTDIGEQWRGFQTWIHRQNWVQQRILLILLAICLGWLACILIIVFAWSWVFGQHTDEMLHGVLAAVIGELIFFSIVGGAVSIVTLRDPSQGTYDERLRILYGQDRPQGNTGVAVELGALLCVGEDQESNAVASSASAWRGGIGKGKSPCLPLAGSYIGLRR